MKMHERTVSRLGRCWAAGLLAAAAHGGCAPHTAPQWPERVVASAVPEKVPGRDPSGTATLTGLRGEEDLAALKQLPPLGTLRVVAKRLDDLSFLADQPHLRHLHLELEDEARFDSLERLATLRHLSTLSICALGHRLGDLMQRLPPLKVRKLSLAASSCTRCDFSLLARHENLHELAIYAGDIRIPKWRRAPAVDAVSLAGVESLSLFSLFVIHPRIEGIEHLLGSQIRTLGLLGGLVRGTSVRPEPASEAEQDERSGVAHHVRRMHVHRQYSLSGVRDISAIGAMTKLRELSITANYLPFELDLAFLDALPLESASVVGVAREPRSRPRGRCRTYEYALVGGSTRARTPCPAECEVCVDVAGAPDRRAFFPSICTEGRWSPELPSDAALHGKRFRE